MMAGAGLELGVLPQGPEGCLLQDAGPGWAVGGRRRPHNPPLVCGRAGDVSEHAGHPQPRLCQGHVGSRGASRSALRVAGRPASSRAASGVRSGPTPFKGGGGGGQTAEKERGRETGRGGDYLKTKR